MSFLRRLFGGRANPGKQAVPEGGRGMAPDQPILCHGPAGERAFIDGLRCPNGHRQRAERVGSLGGRCPAPASHESLFPDERPAEQCMVDRYRVACEGGEHTCTLYFDMYHPDPPEQNPPGDLVRVPDAP